MSQPPMRLSFFFFNDTATTEIYTLSLHDALPICSQHTRALSVRLLRSAEVSLPLSPPLQEAGLSEAAQELRSEEHTSELQSQSNLVCRLLLEKKKKTTTKSQHRESMISAMVHHAC